MAHIEMVDAESAVWERVCAVDSVGVDRGVAVLVSGEPVALFRLSGIDGGSEEWCAVSHIDPVTGAPVMARGLVGSTGDTPHGVATVASPLHKERYNLRTGVGIDDPSTQLATFDVRVLDGCVEISAVVIPRKPGRNEAAAE